MIRTLVSDQSIVESLDEAGEGSMEVRSGVAGQGARAEAAHVIDEKGPKGCVSL